MLIPLAITLGVVASICFALGATGQHLGVDRNFQAEGTDSRAMTLSRLLKLVVTPMWIGGLLLIGLGASMHIVALKLAPITVVQPLGILAVPFSILLAGRIHKTRTTPQMWGFVAMTVAGIVGFTVLSSLTAVDHAMPTIGQVMTAGAVVGVFSAVLAVLACAGPAWAKVLAWAWAGAVLYGLGSGFIKFLTIEWGRWSSPLFWGPAIGLVVAYALGGWMIQQAYASGPAEIVVGVMTTVDPVIAVVFGLLVLDEGRLITSQVAAGMVAFAVLSAVGVFLLSKHHPEAQQHRRDVAAAHLGG